MPRQLLAHVSKAIARVLLNGSDPNQPAVRWNGTEMESQDFPAWRDYRDEACAAIAAYDEYAGTQRAAEREAPMIELQQMISTLRGRDDKLCLDAADEIECLRAALKNARRAMIVSVTGVSDGLTIHDTRQWITEADTALGDRPT